MTDMTFDIFVFSFILNPKQQNQGQAEPSIIKLKNTLTEKNHFNQCIKKIQQT